MTEVSIPLNEAVAWSAWLIGCSGRTVLLHRLARKNRAVPVQECHSVSRKSSYLQVETAHDCIQPITKCDGND